MAEQVIQQADLRYIENNLSAIHSELRGIDSGLDSVNGNVKVVYKEIGSLAQEFHDFVYAQQRSNRLLQAETKLVKIRQELENKYGHYDIVRRTTTGILQADDIGIVRRETISTATEELMISTPGYWLAPCLVALAAWINDQPELAERALKEGIKRNDEKTSLFFALICRRAGRRDACLKWIQRYLANQDEEDLDRKTVIVLDAYASGLFGSDTEGIISRQMNEWLERLVEKPGFVEEQTRQWAAAINLKRQPIDSSSYTYLRKYSDTWPALDDVLEGAHLHAEMLSYLMGIFEQEASTATVKEQLDEILTSLVTDFDDEELPLRKEERFEQFVVDLGGDEDRARRNMQLEESSFEVHKNFTQLLTDAAMNPESSHSSVSTQKFAFALSRDWVLDAYNDVIAKNRMKIPNDISISLDGFTDKTTDGSNEDEMIAKYETHVESQRRDALDRCSLSAFEQFCLYGGGLVALVGIIMMFVDHKFLGFLAIIAGAGLVINHFSKKRAIQNRRDTINAEYDLQKENGTKIIRAFLAEVVDYRIDFSQKDSESSKVLEFLRQIEPDQYVRKLADSNRRIMV